MGIYDFFAPVSRELLVLMVLIIVAVTVLRLRHRPFLCRLFLAAVVCFVFGIYFSMIGKLQDAQLAPVGTLGPSADDIAAMVFNIAGVVILALDYLLDENHRILRPTQFLKEEPRLVSAVATGILLIGSWLLHLYDPRIHVYYPAVALSCVFSCTHFLLMTDRWLVERESELADERINRMIEQIRPHFIRNTMQTIRELCYSNPKKAAACLDSFSEYLNTNLTAFRDNGMIPFSEELEHIKTYASLELAEPKTYFDLNFDLETTRFQVPVLSIQTLVENAVHHGVLQRASGGQVTLSTRRLDSEIMVMIEDNGPGFDALDEVHQKGAGIGIKNTRYRIEELCGGSIKTESSPKGTIVTVLLPARQVGASLTDSVREPEFPEDEESV